jgi:hypothetical protein
MTRPLDDTDYVFNVLSDARRRHVLYYLREHDATSLDELADVIAGWLMVDRVTITTPTRRDRIRIKLHHVHLPMLDDIGFLAYDRESNHARLRDLSDEAEALIDRSLAVERARRTEETAAEPSQEG